MWYSASSSTVPGSAAACASGGWRRHSASRTMSGSSESRPATPGSRRRAFLRKRKSHCGRPGHEQDLELLVADADERDVDVVGAERLVLLGRRGDVDREVPGARLLGLERQFDLLLLGVAEDEVLAVLSTRVAVLELDLDGAAVEALRLDGHGDPRRVADGDPARR